MADDYTITIRRNDDPPDDLPVGVSCTLEHINFSNTTPFVQVSIGAFRRQLRAEEISTDAEGALYLRDDVVRALVAEADAFHEQGASR